MNSTVAKIRPFAKVVPMIYAYNTPGVSYHEGWTKIGYTEKQSVNDRIKQQTHTAGIRPALAWQDNAMYKDGSGDYFTDHEFHSYLESVAGIEREPGTEWFQVDGKKSQEHFNSFTRREYPKEVLDKSVYTLRKEQEEAVKRTKEYFENGGKEFLWNAKPRFGKTLTAYDLVRQMKLQRVLIVSNRPSISNSWAEDFYRFIGWHEEYRFVSENDALKGKPGVISRDNYVNNDVLKKDWSGMIAFESLQGLKSADGFGGQYKKLEWIKQLEFDLLIVDESQEGVDTIRTDQVFQNIKKKYTLYMSGTPFKALANETFANDQIFNWSYADEQETKKEYEGKDYNPYEFLPRLSMFTYQLSNMIYEEVQKGFIYEEEQEEYAFDLNEFFATNESGKFIYEEEIKKFLHTFTTGKKYPFSTPELREELSHTLWLLNRVASAKALATLLEKDPVFSEYKIVLAAGDGRLSEERETERAFDRVKKAIQDHEKTITISVGQLTVGVTIPEWSGVLMLCNMTSPSSYMQAAFRAQNPCIITKNGKRYRKETAYVFDFDPARTLIIFDEFANNLRSDTTSSKNTTGDRKENIQRLLNFFPVLGEDNEGQMVELDATKVLSIPRRIKSREVVQRGFMSNFLFQNISNIFGASAAVREIIEKIAPAHEEFKTRKQSLDGIENVTVDKNGKVEIATEIVIGKAQDLFGKKIYEEPSPVKADMDAIAKIKDLTELKPYIKKLSESTKENLKENIIIPAVQEYGVSKGFQKRIEKQWNKEIGVVLEKLQSNCEKQTQEARKEFENKRNKAQTEKEVQEAEIEYQSNIEETLNSLKNGVYESVKQFCEEKPVELVERLERNKKESEKKTIEDKVKDHLRGFARTIPSFIMAYGNGKLTLENFDKNTEDEVFFEVTGITKDEFRFLRDGGEYENGETGKTEFFEGHLFDEVVFNDSIKEFWDKKTRFSNYFDESQDEDIFDYIPPQKTNQIFTPRWVVQKMVDALEENNPGCFDNPNHTFADLYMKSGLYITEIVKRLYRSNGLKTAFPDKKERIKHILRNQVYGMAPTRIIYLIATNYILGFNNDLKNETKNFVEADAAEASKNGMLNKLVEEHFG